MSRVCTLCALTDAKVDKLRAVPVDERFGYVLDAIEDRLAGTPRFCELDKAELDKALYGTQCCLCGGIWNEDNRLPSNIVFGGEFLLETDDVAITLKNHQDVAEIAAYLRQNDLQKIISSGFWNITDEGFIYKI